MTWILDKTKSCPRCSNPIEVTQLLSLCTRHVLTDVTQKNGGCNHMKCERCSLHFCWICMSPISGYEHFSGGCRLFTVHQNLDPWE
jgi:ariadne-1